MVILKNPLSRAQILGLKGVIDFYSWKGIPVARRWPRRPRMPRSPAVQATAADFRFVTQGFKEIQASAKAALTGMTTGTQLTEKDEQVILFYGGAISELNGPWPYIPPPAGDLERMLQIDLATAPTQAEQTLSVASATYITRVNLLATVDFSVTSYTHFRITAQARSSTAAQTITMQLAAQATPLVPLSPAGNDLVIPRTLGYYDSGWVPFAAPQHADLPLQLSVHGSNGTVNLLHTGIRLSFKYDP